MRHVILTNKNNGYVLYKIYLLFSLFFLLFIVWVSKQNVGKFVRITLSSFINIFLKSSHVQSGVPAIFGIATHAFRLSLFKIQVIIWTTFTPNIVFVQNTHKHSLVFNHLHKKSKQITPPTHFTNNTYTHHIIGLISPGFIS